MLSQQQQVALEALLAGETQREAARLAGVHQQQISRWKKQPEFAQALAAGHAGTISTIVVKLTPLIGPAASAVKEVLKSGSHALRLEAAKIVFAEVHKGLDVEQFLSRIADLEGQLNELLDQEGHAPVGAPRTPSQGLQGPPAPRLAAPPDSGPVDGLRGHGPGPVAG